MLRRTLTTASAILAMTTAAHADAQYRVPSAPRPAGWTGGSGAQRPDMHRQATPRWGGRVDGRWWGGARAPGGWGAYRRPVRGYALPTYWVAPRWHVNDWAGYGLSQPPRGYNWSRYYDDAVLIDARGSVYDTVPGIGWDRYDAPDVDYAYDDRGDGGYPQLPYPSRDADNGLGGAAIGAVVGGVAGNLIAGRGNRLGGTLLGAGAGALAGMAIDRSDRAGREDRGAPYPPPRDDRGAYPPRDDRGPYPAPHDRRDAPVVAYQQGSYGGDYAGTTYSGTTYYGDAPPPHDRYPDRIVTRDGTVITTSGTAGHVAGGYYYPGATITTITVSGGGGGETYEEVYDTRVHRAPARRHTKGCRC